MCIETTFIIWESIPQISMTIFESNWAGTLRLLRLVFHQQCRTFAQVLLAQLKLGCSLIVLLVKCIKMLVAKLAHQSPNQDMESTVAGWVESGRLVNVWLWRHVAISGVGKIWKSDPPNEKKSPKNPTIFIVSLRIFQVPSSNQKWQMENPRMYIFWFIYLSLSISMLWISISLSTSAYIYIYTCN